MGFSSRTVLALLALCTCATTAQAAGGPASAVEASLTWHLDFGAQSLHAGYGAAFGYRSGEHFAPLSRLIDLNVSDALAMATVAGLPLIAHSYQANQEEAGVELSTLAEARPWYTRGWVLWTAGGLAATAALAGSGGGGGDGSRTCSGTCNQTSSSGSGISVNGNDVSPPPGANACAPNPAGSDVCVFCNHSVVSSCGSGFTEQTSLTGRWDQVVNREWLDSGTGGMGDLVAQP